MLGGIFFYEDYFLKDYIMLQLSKFPFKTLKSAPKVSDNKSTSLLLQG